MRTLRDSGHDVVSLDIKPSAFTSVIGSVADPEVVAACMQGVDTVFHAATLHKPHVATHSPQAFIDTNVSGTLQLLQHAADQQVRRFVFTSTTSVFGDALRPPPGTPAAWVTEDVQPVPKNIYGVTKTAAEDLCLLYHRQHDLNCIILRTSRFFPEDDDDKAKRDRYAGDNAKANEFLFRRVELEDVVSAHLAAAQKASDLGFGRYVISATTPFCRADLFDLNCNAGKVVEKYYPGYMDVYSSLGWEMFETIDRVYINDAARKDLGWQPKYDFNYVLGALRAGSFPQSRVAAEVGSKGYHKQKFKDGPYPTLD